ncbi:UGSC family (seleno)protein [Caballeronia sp. J97]|uniref:UGSC family (seleno)protein n=1 Tax=Caballeronia sp. J97 TaxID=2805429 RepID=UPI002AB1A4D4|nr:UGSC family (seleno)protein [Caballeronia sp. J97]
MTMIEIVVPEVTDAPPETQHKLAARAKGLSEARLTLIVNGKPKSKEMLEMIAERLKNKVSIAAVNFYQKPAATHVIDEEEVATIVESSDIVIAGLGDCGACSASSLADAVKMEIAGVPATVLITDVFTGNVASFAAAMGMPGYHTVTVPHPVSSKSDKQLEQYANAVVDQVVTQLTNFADRVEIV